MPLGWRRGVRPRCCEDSAQLTRPVLWVQGCCDFQEVAPGVRLIYGRSGTQRGAPQQSFCPLGGPTTARIGPVAVSPATFSRGQGSASARHFLALHSSHGHGDQCFFPLRRGGEVEHRGSVGIGSVAVGGAIPGRLPPRYRTVSAGGIVPSWLATMPATVRATAFTSRGSSKIISTVA